MSKKVVSLLLLIILAASLLYGYYAYKQRKTFMADPPIASVLSAESTSSPAASPSGPWKVFGNAEVGFTLKHPPEIEVKQESEDVFTLFSKDINISVVEGKLSENETINTLAEKQVNYKMEKLADKFVLVDTISPIAIDSVTGITYKSDEPEGRRVYFYIPRGNHGYLLITNQIRFLSDPQLISLSDEIIYSLKLLP